jgi:hypothetical protein
MDRFDKQVSQAALDVAVERTSNFYSSQLSFDFGETA